MSSCRDDDVQLNITEPCFITSGHVAILTNAPTVELQTFGGVHYGVSLSGTSNGAVESLSAGSGLQFVVRQFHRLRVRYQYRSL